MVPGVHTGAGATRRLGRRRFLIDASAAASAAVALSYARWVPAQPARLTTTQVAAGLLAVIGPNATVLAADSSDGVVLVDGGDAAWSDSLLQTPSSCCSPMARIRRPQMFLASRRSWRLRES